MRKKNLVGARRPSPNPSATVPSPSTIPLLSTAQDEHNATVFDSDGDNDDGNHHHHQPHVPMPDHPPEPVDLFDENICISCEGCDGTLLVCSERGCPVVLHASCFGSEPKFDASGSFYCPYCWYKRALNECRQLRQKAMLAKEALSSFLDNKPQTARNDDEEHRAEPAQDLDRGQPETRETGGLEGIERCETALDEEGKGSAAGSFVSETNDSDYHAASVKKRPAKRKGEKKAAYVKKSLMESNVGDENGEVSSSATSRQSKQGTQWSLLTGKRKKLFWTADEEKALKEGVLRFSVENRNIPWRKILEFGCGVFDKTRAPSDLKDKWKKMSSEKGQLS